MALDPIVLNLGSGGDSIGSDNVGGVNYEIVKAAFGAVGTVTLVEAAAPLPVTDALGSTAAKQDTGNTSLASIDGKLTSPLTVQATNLDIRDLVFASDKVDASGSVLGAGANVIGHVIVDTAPVTHVIADSGTITTVGAVTAITNALPSGSNVIGHVIVDTAPVTHVIADSGTITTVSTVTSITNNVNTVEVVATTIFNGKTTVATAGSRGTLAASQAVKSVTIKALSTNTGFIYVGNSSVTSANGFQLLAGESISMDVANLNTVNIDSSVNGEGVTYIAVS